MTTFDAGTIVGGPGARPAARLSGDRPRPGRRLRDGRRQAGRDLAKRSTRGRELASLPFFLDLSTNRRALREGLRPHGRGDGADLQLGLRRPRTSPSSRAGGCRCGRPSVDPGLPTKGTGEYEWQGFLRRRPTPQASTRRPALILNWNNKPARGVRGGRRRVDVGPGAARRPALGAASSGRRSTRSRASSAR